MVEEREKTLGVGTFEKAGVFVSDFLHPSLPGVVEAREEEEERRNHGKRMGWR